MNKLTLREAQTTLAALHARHYEATGACAAPHRWADCDVFALARLRGVGHTVYVVQDPADGTYLVIDWWGEGPEGGLGADVSDPYPADSWGDAVLAGLRLLLADPEFGETVHGATALGLAARALAEADAMAARYTP